MPLNVTCVGSIVSVCPRRRLGPRRPRRRGRGAAGSTSRLYQSRWPVDSTPRPRAPFRRRPPAPTQANWYSSRSRLPRAAAVGLVEEPLEPGDEAGRRAGRSRPPCPASDGDAVRGVVGGLGGQVEVERCRRPSAGRPPRRSSTTPRGAHRSARRAGRSGRARARVGGDGTPPARSPTRGIIFSHCRPISRRMSSAMSTPGLRERDRAAFDVGLERPPSSNAARWRCNKRAPRWGSICAC